MDSAPPEKPSPGDQVDSEAELDHAPSGVFSRALPIILVLVVAAAVVGIYWPVLSTQALSLDDRQYLVDNALVKQPSLESVGRFFGELWQPSTVRGYYQPLAMISLMADCALGGGSDNLQPFRTTALCLHVLNSLLVVLFVYVLFGQLGPAAAVGLLFGVHPLTVESVAWLAQRKTLLGTFFALWSFILYIRYTRRQGRPAYGASLGMYVLALLAKPTTIMLPLAMLVLDYWPLRRLSRRCLLEKLPFFIVGACSAVVTFISQSQTAGTALPTEDVMLRVPLVLCHNVVFYLHKFVWPVHLAVHYSYPDPLSLSHSMVLAGVVGTILLIIVLLLSLRWTRAFLAGSALFYVVIFPALGVVGFMEAVAGDRFAYLPAIGVLLPLAWLVSVGWGGKPRSGGVVVRRVVLVALVLVVASAEGRATRRYLAHWQDTEEHFRYMIAATPNAPMLRYGLGYCLQGKGDLDGAIGEYREALRLRPGFADVHHDLGVALHDQGKIGEAISSYRKALEISPDLRAARRHLALAFDAEGEIHDAIEQYGLALALDEADADTHNRLAQALVNTGKIEQAMTHFASAIRLRSDFVEARNGLGVALDSVGRLEEARQQYREALRIDPEYSEAHNSLANTLLKMGRQGEALQHYRQALEIKPAYAEAHYNLAVLLASQGQREEAIAHYEKALQARADYFEAHNNLANTLAQSGRLEEAIAHYRQALRIQPELVEGHRNLAIVLSWRGRTAEAVKVYREGLWFMPETGETYFMLGKLLDLDGRRGEAIEQYQAALRLDPHHAEARRRLAGALAQTQETPED